VEILEVLAKMDEHLARQDTMLARQDATLAKIDEHLARQDAILAKQDDTLRLIASHMARLGELMASCHHEAAAAHQTAAVALSRFAEVTLGVDRFVTLAERLLERLADRR
jgi:uncharacterized coiled-coil protein SlyX